MQQNKEKQIKQIYRTFIISANQMFVFSLSVWRQPGKKLFEKREAEREKNRGNRESNGSNRYVFYSVFVVA